ncbi:suppressor of fused domain protein [Streptosporangium saharense]|uniref:suppressor of fused domain protein n=1 Tax=Streptosporangium saharense TaxID=1706840 RepID=UPI003694E030
MDIETPAALGYTSLVMTGQKASDAPDRFARFMECLGSMLGMEPDVHEVPPREPQDGRVLALTYVDTPEPGLVSGFAYGLSLWQGSPARELCVMMRSSDPEWAKVPAVTVAALRGMCPFDPGMVIGYMKPYVTGSRLSSLFLATPPTELGLAERIDLSTDPEDSVEIVGAYPIHASERRFVHARGAEALWDSRWDPFDPARPPAL